jgi:hypothetical protein
VNYDCLNLKKIKLSLIKGKKEMNVTTWDGKGDNVTSSFISYYFEPHLRTRINYVSRHDDGGEVPSRGNLSIFSSSE